MEAELSIPITTIGFSTDDTVRFTNGERRRKAISETVKNRKPVKTQINLVADFLFLSKK